MRDWVIDGVVFHAVLSNSNRSTWTTRLGWVGFSVGQASYTLIIQFSYNYPILSHDTISNQSEIKIFRCEK